MVEHLGLHPGYRGQGSVRDGEDGGLGGIHARAASARLLGADVVPERRAADKHVEDAAGVLGLAVEMLVQVQPGVVTLVGAHVLVALAHILGHVEALPKGRAGVRAREVDIDPIGENRGEDLGLQAVQQEDLVGGLVDATGQPACRAGRLHRQPRMAFELLGSEYVHVAQDLLLGRLVLAPEHGVLQPPRAHHAQPVVPARALDVLALAQMVGVPHAQHPLEGPPDGTILRGLDWQHGEAQRRLGCEAPLPVRRQGALLGDGEDAIELWLALEGVRERASRPVPSVCEARLPV
mmetsp:Transcript_26581/g.67566  ORF Transcript_26581/g.67566 Transcript_26581/m.67566 type:complete len:293 (+) Transcript_26581:296-1174(+)